MRGYHPEEIATMNEEEIDNLINELFVEKDRRKEHAIETLTDELENLLQKIEDGGFHLVYLDENGFEYMLDVSDWKIE